MNGIISLGRYQGNKIRGLINYVAAKGWVAQLWDWRDPVYNQNLNGNETVENWHRDGDCGLSDPTKYFIVWSSCETTMIKLPDGSIYRPYNEEVIIIDNGICKHKKRKNLGPNRLFARGLGAQKITWKNNCEQQEIS